MEKTVRKMWIATVLACALCSLISWGSGYWCGTMLARTCEPRLEVPGQVALGGATMSTNKFTITGSGYATRDPRTGKWMPLGKAASDSIANHR